MLALWNPAKVGAKQFHRASNFASKIISRGEPCETLRSRSNEVAVS